MLGNLYQRNIILKDEGFSINYVFVSLGVLLSILLTTYLYLHYSFIPCIIVLTIIAIVYFFVYKIFKRKLLFLNNNIKEVSKGERVKSKFNKLKILLFTCICFLSIFFWIGYEYGITVLFNLNNNFSDVLKEISIFGNSFNINTFQYTISTIFIVILGIIVASYFTSKAIKSRKITPFFKISIGFFLMAISYTIIYFVLEENDFVITDVDSGKLLITLVVLFALQAVAEMLITPIILSFIDTMANVSYKSTTIALYFFSTFTIKLLVFIETPENNGVILLKISFVYLLSTIIILLCKDRLQKMTQTVLSK